MLVTALHLHGVRNLAPMQLTPGPRFNVFAGDNGQGKTNLLEAVYVLATLRSFRTSALAEVIGHGHERAQLRARVVRAELERQYQVVLEPARKTAIVDDKPVRPIARYFGAFNVVLFAPEDLAVVRGPPADRRRFLDRTVFGRRASFLATAQTFEKVLRSRNAVLRGLADGERGGRDLLDVYDQQLAPLAVAMVRARRELLAELAPRLTAVYAAITGGELPLAVVYQTAVADDPAAVVAQLAADRPRDLARRSTSTGPHRDDLVFRLADHLAAGFASQGQTRALVLAWKIAELELLAETHGDAPLLLLDDVSSELDDTRNEFLFSYLSKRPGQCFITTTDARHVRITGERIDRRVQGGVVS
ncbi:MAG: DNA replication/repair protein RecF [Myxococcales bacterium]|nr:DNA replication/repair protein RecF [Myxococcales bacterium]